LEKKKGSREKLVEMKLKFRLVSRKKGEGGFPRKKRISPKVALETRLQLFFFFTAQILNIGSRENVFSGPHKHTASQ
jgi:hypothetical protein